MEVWEAFVDRLTAKEKELNEQIQEQVYDLCKKNDTLRDQMKEMATKATNVKMHVILVFF